jgi:hypothetical protein
MNFFRTQANQRTGLPLVKFFSSFVIALSCLTSISANAQGSNRPIATARDLAEIKAECQRYAKLYVERVVGREAERVGRRMVRTQAELQHYAAQAPSWEQSGVPVDKSNLLVGDIRQLITIATGVGKPNDVAALIGIADRCSTDAEALMRDVRGGLASSKVMQLAARSLYLSQRAVRDTLLTSHGIKIQGVSADLVTKEREELGNVLREIGTLPATPGMKTSLELVTNQWALVRPALARTSGSSDTLDQTLRASEQMFEALDDLFDEMIKAAMAFN